MFILVLVYLCFCAFIPASYKVERSVSIKTTSKSAYNFYRSHENALKWNKFLEEEKDVKFLGDEGQIGNEISTPKAKFVIKETIPTEKLVFSVENKDYPSLNSLSFEFYEIAVGEISIIVIAEGRHSFLKRFFNLKMNHKLDKELNHILKMGVESIN